MCFRGGSLPQAPRPKELKARGWVSCHLYYSGTGSQPKNTAPHLPPSTKTPASDGAALSPSTASPTGNF